MDMKLRRWVPLAALLLLFTGCGVQPTALQERTEPSPQPVELEPATPVEELPADGVQAMVEAMTLRQKVGQLFMVRPDALDPTLSQEEIDDENADGVTCLTDAMRQTLAEYPVGGICQFGKNLADPEQLRQFNADLQAASDLPLLLAVDEEGGPVARLANHPAFDLPRYESVAAVGAAGDPAAAREMGRTIGGYLRDYGFTMDFAPVADVYTNPANTVIGGRAFSGDGAEAAAMAWAMAQGLEEQGILPTFKHFPGHGDTAQDSHSGLAVATRSREEMEQCEWLPFARPSAGAEVLPYRAVMVGHIAAPALGGGETPASLSQAVVTDLLRNELLQGEDVLIVTDSLAMGAITQQYTPAQAAVQALQAGCDILLMPDGLAEAFDGVVAAVEDGTISQQRLEESVARILRYKQQYAGLQAAAEQ